MTFLAILACIRLSIETQTRNIQQDFKGRHVAAYSAALPAYLEKVV